MTIRERIIAFLQGHPAGAGDNELAAVVGVLRRQQVGDRCRQLAEEGLIAREAVNGKIHNSWLLDPRISAVPLLPIPARDLLWIDDAKPWFWEGNVQSVAARYLVSQGYAIRSAADTATKEHGKDIVAEHNGITVWMTVKGYPKGTARTGRSLQAGHWFKQAIFDIIAYRGENAAAELGLVLPDFPRYHSLMQKVTWFQPVACFAYYWVHEDGDVVVEQTPEG